MAQAKRKQATVRKAKSHAEPAPTDRLNLTLPAWAIEQLQEIAGADFLERTDIARIAVLGWLRENYPRYRKGD